MYFRTYTNSYKALLVCIISFFLTFTPSLVFATTVSAEGWSVSKRIVQGATTFYDGTKNIVINGKNYAATGTAKITPAAAQVSKMIVRVGAVVAVDLAIKALIGAVDYTMDPANNEVIYKVPGENPPATNCKTDFSDCPPQINNLWRNSGLQNTFFFTPQSACDNLATVTKTTLTSMVQQNATNYRCYIVDTKGVSNSYVVSASINPKYDPNAPPAPDTSETKRLPYDAVASQIMSDAMAEKPEGKAFVSSVADTSLDPDEQKQIVPASDVTQQLNNSQAIPTNGTGTGAIAPPTTIDPTTGEPVTPKPSDLTINFPEFCGWAPLVCQAAQSAINFPSTAAGWWKSLADYLKGYDTWLNAFGKDDVNYPELDEYKIQEPDLDISVHQYFDSSAFCPEDRHVPLSMGGQSLDLIISYSALCTVAQQFRPAVILMSFLAGAFIITNTGRRAETGD